MSDNQYNFDVPRLLTPRQPIHLQIHTTIKPAQPLPTIRLVCASQDSLFSALTLFLMDSQDSNLDIKPSRMAIATLHFALRASQQTARLRQHRVVIITGILCLVVLIAPAVFPVSHATKATRWIKDAATQAQTTACNADMPLGYGPRVTEPL